MAIFKCKMCGGDLEVLDGVTVCECEYCGTKQTVPTTQDEVITNLYNRANNLRIRSEFDKAQETYEKIVSKNPDEAEAYWGIVLCKYGIEYVEDPDTFKRVPTCHRTQLESVMTDVDYLSAIEHADSIQKDIYEQEAKDIDLLQKDILSIVHKEKPFDVFICYKETDENGKRTVDSVVANDIYHQLTQEGFKVFYAAITLEDKLGQEYEPYIFAALNSAKVMLVVGTKPEHFNAVWVKNEWSRYLKLMKNDRKRTLIPCYRDMDAYDLPEEFSHLQAQDMGKIGFINDVVRGIKKLIATEEPRKQETVVVNQNAGDVAPLLKRAFMFLEDGNWKDADEYCERVLDLDPENAQAYLGKLMAELKVHKQDDLAKLETSFDESDNYIKAARYANEKLRDKLNSYLDVIRYNDDEKMYKISVDLMATAKTEEDFINLAESFELLENFKDSKELAVEFRDKAEEARKDAILSKGKSKMSGEIISSYEAAIKLFESISGWRDADDFIVVCEKKIEEIKAKAETERLENERQAERKAKRNKKIAIITTPIICAVIAFIILLNAVIIPNGKYNDAIALMDAGKHDEAYSTFAEIKSYKDSDERMSEIMKPYFISQKPYIAAGYNYTIGLKNDGTLISAGSNDSGQCDVSDWKDIVAVSAGNRHTVGLKSDGTVVAAGSNNYGECNIEDWKDIKQISAGHCYTVGLKNDGTVIATGSGEYGKCGVTSWKDIVSISAGFTHTVGLKSDGTVVAVGENNYGQCDVSNWKEIIAVSANGDQTIGLEKDGNVVAVGENNYRQCDVSNWKDIVSISAGFTHTVGLKSDGTVVAVGENNYGQCDVSDWTDIVAVLTGVYHTVGLKSDGTVVVAGKNDDGQCDVKSWNNIKTK